MKNLEFQPKAFDQFMWWIQHDRKKALRIAKLMRTTQRTPFTGVGKPEKLKGNLSGYWSRRIDQEHRFVYKVLRDKIIVLSCKYHYAT